MRRLVLVRAPAVVHGQRVAVILRPVHHWKRRLRQVLHPIPPSVASSVRKRLLAPELVADEVWDEVALDVAELHGRLRVDEEVAHCRREDVALRVENAVGDGEVREPADGLLAEAHAVVEIRRFVQQHHALGGVQADVVDVRRAAGLLLLDALLSARGVEGRELVQEHGEGGALLAVGVDELDEGGGPVEDEIAREDDEVAAQELFLLQREKHVGGAQAGVHLEDDGLEALGVEEGGRGERGAAWRRGMERRGGS